MKTIIFDMDGVIIDSEPLHRKLEQDIYARLGLHISEEEHVKYTGTSSLEMWAEIVEKHNINIPPKEIAWQKHQDYIYKLKEMKTLPAVDGAVEYIHSLHQAGYTLVVASSSERDQIELIVRRLGINHCFSFLVSGAELPKSKPDPMIFLKAAELTQTAPEQCCVIEDSHHGVTAAKAAGMACIAFKNPNSGNQDLSQADVVIDSFAQVKKTGGIPLRI